MSSRFASAALVAALVVWFSATARAQPAEGRSRYAEEPTLGLESPGVPLSGEHDARAVTANPAGLPFLRGNHVGLQLSLDDDDEATTGGAGFGLYDGFAIGGGVLPALGFGLGVEILRPARAALAPDPGDPTRLSLAWALGLGPSAGVGVTWHRFFGDAGAALDGTSTWDLGLAARMGPRFALGAVLRDAARPAIDGVPVQRRYELELTSRPLATDLLELSLGGRVGETRGDLDGWLYGSLALMRGVYLRGELEYRELVALVPTATGVVEDDRRELRATVGLELSFGRVGITGYGTLASLDGDDARLRGGSVFVRLSTEPVPAIQGEREHIERLELSGEMSDRDHTNLMLRLRQLRRDPAVVAVFLQIDGLNVGWAQAQELRGQLTLLRAAGKRSFAYLVAGTMRDYYVASAADRVYVDLAGGLWLSGFAATTIYFKGLFDKLGVLAQFEKIDEFKSAPEAYTRTDPSDAALAMRNALYDDLFEVITAEIAEGRRIAPAEVARLIDSGPFTAGQLGELPQLVDAVVQPEQLDGLLAQELGAVYPVVTPVADRPERWALDAIAVIYIDGDIVSGASSIIPGLGRKLVGGDTIAQAIAAARADDSVKAIVLRIDSPGGSALASEIMAREVFATRGVKPVICSMGNLAASGGYFVAAGCDHIFAEPTTVTGSIGIFTGKFDVSGLMARAGLTWHTYRRGDSADRESLFRPYTEVERDKVQAQIRYYYERFVGYVARGRSLTAEQVDAVGRGRVWTGRQAREVALVDQFGGVADAIALAQQRAGIDDDTPVRIAALPVTPASVLARLLGLSVGSRGDRDAGAVLPWLVGDLLQALPGSLLAEPRAPQARLPFEIAWDAR